MPKATVKQVAARKIFVSYSHADYAQALRLHMELDATCRRLGDTAVFLDCKGDSQLMAGDAWRAKIMAALEAADVFIALLSADFIASDFCRDVELRHMLLRSVGPARVRVIGVALHQVTLKNFSAQIDGTPVYLAER